MVAVVLVLVIMMVALVADVTISMPLHYSLSKAASDCVTHIWPIPMVCINIPCDIPERDPPRTYIRTL